MLQNSRRWWPNIWVTVLLLSTILVVWDLLLPLWFIWSLLFPLRLLDEGLLLVDNNMLRLSLLEGDISSFLAFANANNNKSDYNKEDDETSSSHFNWFSAATVIISSRSDVLWLRVSAGNAGLKITSWASSNLGVVSRVSSHICTIAAVLTTLALRRCGACFQVGGGRWVVCVSWHSVCARPAGDNITRWQFGDDRVVLLIVIFISSLAAGKGALTICRLLTLIKVTLWAWYCRIGCF